MGFMRSLPKEFREPIGMDGKVDSNLVLGSLHLSFSTRGDGKG